MNDGMTQLSQHRISAVNSLAAARRHEARGDLEEAQLCYASAIMDLELAMGILEFEKNAMRDS